MVKGWEIRVEDRGVRVKGGGFMDWGEGLEFRVQSLWMLHKRLKCKVSGSLLMVEGLRLRVQHSGLRVKA